MKAIQLRAGRPTPWLAPGLATERAPPSGRSPDAARGWARPRGGGRGLRRRGSSACSPGAHPHATVPTLASSTPGGGRAG